MSDEVVIKYKLGGQKVELMEDDDRELDSFTLTSIARCVGGISKKYHA